MGRKNDRVRRKNANGRLPRRARGERPVKVPGPTAIPSADLTRIILPDGQCRAFGKVKARFATKEKAAQALKQAQKTRARTGSLHVEKRYYPCPEGGCGGFHLTSREEYDPTIGQFRHQQFLDQTKNKRREEIRREQQQ